MSHRYEMTESRAENCRIMAAELLNEANARGDQNWEAVGWAVGYLLRRANQIPTPTQPPSSGVRATASERREA